MVNKGNRMKMMNEMNEVCQRMESEIQNMAQKLKTAVDEVMIFLVNFGLIMPIVGRN